MYRFIDTTENRVEGFLPSEALRLNGTYLENVIPGYRTLTVRGRELSDYDIRSIQVGRSDGQRYLDKRIPSRVIQVRFQLISQNNATFRSAFNELNRLLSVEHVEVLFRDEPDKFFIGTPSSVSDIPTGTNQIKGSFDILCADPFKYSVREFEVTPELDEGRTFAVDYRGDFPAFPKLEANIHGDNGFLGFIDSDMNILQFGDPEESNVEAYRRNEILFNVEGRGWQHFTNGGTFFRRPAWGTNGSFANRNALSRNWLTLSNQGSASVPSNQFRGAVRTITLPADSSGVRGSLDWYCYTFHWFETGRMGQTGTQVISFLDADDRQVCAMVIAKTDRSGNTAQVTWETDFNRVFRRQNFQAHAFAGNGFNAFNGRQLRGHNDFLKVGNTLRVFWYGRYFTHTLPEIANRPIHKIQIYMGQLGDRAVGNQYVTRNDVAQVIFQKMNVQRWRDVPNKFTEGDTFSADCRSGEVLHKGMPAHGLDALGNDWDKFSLKPGMNQIKCVHSDWADQSPDYKLKYREVYL